MKLSGRSRELGFLVITGVLTLTALRFFTQARSRVHIPARIIERCASLHAPLEPSSSFTQDRLSLGSDRYVPGTPPVLLRNAKIWTGARNGTEVVYGDVLLNQGIIQRVGYIPFELVRAMEEDTSMGVKVYDVKELWVTPGLVDMHSHLGVAAAPYLKGSRFLAESQSCLLTFFVCRGLRHQLA